MALDAWVAGIGVAYTYDAWTFGVQHSHLDADNGGDAAITDFTQDRAMLIGAYALGPGIVRVEKPRTERMRTTMTHWRSV